MYDHLFILTPNSWLGDGRIQLSMVQEELIFYTRWSVFDKDSSGKIRCLQEIQVKGLSDVMHNEFAFYDISPNSFAIEMENPAVGKVLGRGVINEKVIAWEFRLPDIGFEGFEFYERQDDKYLMRAEYATTDQFRTVIQGKVWQPEAKGG